jgi:hypothetical protein
LAFACVDALRRRAFFFRRGARIFVDSAREVGKVIGAEPRAFCVFTSSILGIRARRFGDAMSEPSCGEGFRMAGATTTRSGLQRFGRRFAKRAWPLAIAAIGIGAGLFVGNSFRSAPPARKQTALDGGRA